MKKLFSIMMLFCLFALCAHAETIVLRTGACVQGTVVFQNEDVVIIRDASGARSQYPRTDVEAVLADEVEVAQEEEIVEVEEIKTPKKASILVEIAGGGAIIPNETAGGAVSADLLVGSHHIGGRHLFIGGGFGYHGLFFAGEKYSFLPIQFAMRMPVLEQKHAPMFGFSLGYGVGLSKQYKGGAYADVDFGYRCQINEKSAIALVLFAQFQQASLNVTEVVDEVQFTHNVGRNIVSTGIKFGFYF